MKRLLILFTVLLYTVTITYAQSQRMVLLEHFTQASCGPCAASNPTINALVAANPTKMTAIMYHTSWPGTDPMNAHNPADVGVRVGMYGVNAVPRSVIDGNYYNGSPGGWNQNTINARYAVPSPFDIQLQHTLSPSQDSVYITMIVKATTAVTGNLAAYIAVIEKEINFTYPPGTNGEKDFHMVMKKLLPGNAGIKIANSYQAGDYEVIRASWKLANFYNISELAVIGFVQDWTSKEIHQSANSTTSAITPPYTNEVNVMEAYGVGDYHCVDDISPKVLIRNQGAANLTSLTIKYSVNNGTELSHQWTGNLGFMETAVVALPSSSISIQADNYLLIYGTATNGVGDDFAKNDTVRHHFMPAPGTTENVYLILKTDDFPGQTTWEVTDDAGTVVFSGGPFTQANNVFQETYTLTSDGCYQFAIYDAGADGICCKNGYGIYQLTSDFTGQVLGEGDAFGAENLHSFVVGGYQGIKETTLMSKINIFPNPANDEARIGFELKANAEVGIQLTDMLGKVVYEENRAEMMQGAHEISLNTSNLKNGYYFIRVLVDNKIISRKLQIQR